MIYALLVSIGTSGLFLFLFIRSAVTNGNLRNLVKELQKDVLNKQKQLELAANHPDTPDSLAERMRNGTL